MHAPVAVDAIFSALSSNVVDACGLATFEQHLLMETGHTGSTLLHLPLVSRKSGRFALSVRTC